MCVCNNSKGSLFRTCQWKKSCVGSDLSPLLGPSILQLIVSWLHPSLAVFGVIVDGGLLPEPSVDERSSGRWIFSTVHLYNQTNTSTNQVNLQHLCVQSVQNQYQECYFFPKGCSKLSIDGRHFQLFLWYNHNNNDSLNWEQQICVEISQRGVC